MNTAFALFFAAREMDGSCVEVEPDGTCRVVPDPFARELLGALLVVPGLAIFVIANAGAVWLTLTRRLHPPRPRARGRSRSGRGATSRRSSKQTNLRPQGHAC